VGNPNLKPYTGQQYDLGVEWYLSKINYLSATLWRKDITGFPQKIATTQNFFGQDYVMTTYVNSPAPVHITGFEAGSQYGFSFLPGKLKNLGMMANYTYAKDSGYSVTGYFSGAKLGFPACHATASTARCIMRTASCRRASRTTGARATTSGRIATISTPLARLSASGTDRSATSSTITSACSWKA
jgi:outer membrane receptor protein involved in Fe transport